jgi:hypothetical protein
MKKNTKVKIFRFWITRTDAGRRSRNRLFVRKADYDRAIKRIKELEDIINHLDNIDELIEQKYDR